MTTDKKLNANGFQLMNQLAAAKTAPTKDQKGQLINVAGVGRLVSSAY
jgi:hypothetical protein